MNESIVILITCPTLEEAKKITRVLVSKRLIACGNLVPGVFSIFFWEGKLSEENETLIVGKTSKASFPSLVKMVKEHHSYTVPEIIALPIVEGSSEYLKWIEETLQNPPQRS